MILIVNWGKNATWTQVSACQDAQKMLIVTMTSIVTMNSRFAWNFVIQMRIAQMVIVVICLVNVQNNAKVIQTVNKMNIVKGKSSQIVVMYAA